MPMFAPTLRGYRAAWLRVDLVAGLTVGAMLVPQAMAYAELAGLPPEVGFNAALLPLVVYALVGGSRHLGVGPEPGTAILAATGVGLVADGDPVRYLALMAALALVVGLVGLVAAVSRLGVLASLLSKPVLVGYITGVGLTLVSSQLAKATGVATPGDGFFPRIASFVSGLSGWHWATFAVFVGTLVGILTLKQRAPKFPAALAGVVVATLVVWVIGGDTMGVKLIGTIPAALPTLGWPDVALSDVLALVPTALGIALVGYTDNVLTARSVATKHGYTIEPNRELFALGAINLAAGVSGGFPVSSSASRTAVPSSLGSHSQLVGLVAAALLALTLVAAGPALSAMPMAALAAVIVAAALAIIDVAGFRDLWRVSRSEFGLAVVAALAVMVFDVLVGVLIALVMSVALLMRRLSRPHDSVLAEGESLGGWVDARLYGLSPTHPGLLVYRFDAPLFFGNIEHFGARIDAVLTANPGDETWIVLDFEGVGDIDSTALDGLRELTTKLTRAGLVVAVARANAPVMALLGRADLVAPGVGATLRPFPTIKAAVMAFEDAHRTSASPSTPRP